MAKIYNIPPELQKLQERVEKIAKDYGLDCYRTVFQMCDNDAINTLAARGGFPQRYPHWQFGMNYNQFHNQSKYGWGKIYEMVINNDPCYAYLLNTNSMMDQKLVMAHVMGHNDFFKNNDWFAPTDKDMMNTMATHATKITKYMKKYGQDRVESFIDSVLSLENLVSVSELFETPELKRSRKENNERLQKNINKTKLKIHDEALKEILKNDKKVKKEEGVSLNKIKKPTADVLGFLAKNAPLETWESDIVSMIRAEAYYYIPQGMTKIMNEGWASFWHSEIMTKHLLEGSDEVFAFANTHASVMYMPEQGFNPYKIGLEIFRDIKERWDKGRFGPEYMMCDDLYEKDNWDTGAGLGMEKIFQVRKIYNDVGFINEFFTKELCEKQKMFVYKTDPSTGRVYKDSSDFPKIKESLLNQLANGGNPIIKAVDSNFNNAGELLLVHTHHGVGLDDKYIKATLESLYRIWKRPIHLETKDSSGKKIVHKHIPKK